MAQPDIEPAKPAAQSNAPATRSDSGVSIGYPEPGGKKEFCAPAFTTNFAQIIKTTMKIDVSFRVANVNDSRFGKEQRR